MQERGLFAHHHRHRGRHAAVLAELPRSRGAGQDHLHVHLCRRRQEAALPRGVLPWNCVMCTPVQIQFSLLCLCLSWALYLLLSR